MELLLYKDVQTQLEATVEKIILEVNRRLDSKGKIATMRSKSAGDEQIDLELVNKIRRGLEDIKKGRISEWKPK